ncbi:MAG: acylphosphatase [Pseudomonadota bacterium]
MACARFIVTGRVQGVFFRASTRDFALPLGITGYAKNRNDGSVEVLASGSSEALAALFAWLHHGPPAARVAQVQREEMSPRNLQGFTTD